MKHTIYTLLLAVAPLLAAPCHAMAQSGDKGRTAAQPVATAQRTAQQPTGEPQFLETLKPDERTHDFGPIREADGKVNHVFRLKNTGTKPVAISAINTLSG